MVAVVTMVMMVMELDHEALVVVPVMVMTMMTMMMMVVELNGDHFDRGHRGLLVGVVTNGSALSWGIVVSHCKYSCFVYKERKRKKAKNVTQKARNQLATRSLALQF